jgi:hypothetical protein
MTLLKIDTRTDHYLFFIVIIYNTILYYVINVYNKTISDINGILLCGLKKFFSNTRLIRLHIWRNDDDQFNWTLEKWHTHPVTLNVSLKSFGNLYSGWFPNSLISFWFVITLDQTLLSTKHQTTFLYYHIFCNLYQNIIS